ncbi:3-oxoacyl-[acyl-carrier-protein] reductase FabG [bioreactor metagenome]|uniref:3-oxoacyl-[acyl-carrier-protein] reductase FabG n=1 Tax=bioreactor metagenome TaxID=1076179 RepID=A0A645BE15_9ZZZZ|nr:3-oxoacyl-[acyl-carrier-protein] reductase [Oscillospiraceae bacterium]
MLKNKVAIVTGGSRGIGRAICEKFAVEGCSVAIIYQGRQDAAEKTLAEILSMLAPGAGAKVYKCDVSDYDDCAVLVKQVCADFGHIDILVNNAGITRDKLLLAMKPEDFDAVMNVNLKGSFNMIKQVYPLFLRQKSGRIINITSVVGLCGNAGQANYSASKAGLIGLTKSVAKELAGRSICVNAIAPGFINTDMTASLPESGFEESIPARRRGEPADVAALAAFLASDEAGYITGEVIRVDGGLAM